MEFALIIMKYLNLIDIKFLTHLSHVENINSCVEIYVIVAVILGPSCISK